MWALGYPASQFEVLGRKNLLVMVNGIAALPKASACPRDVRDPGVRSVGGRVRDVEVGLEPREMGVPV